MRALTVPLALLLAACGRGEPAERAPAARTPPAAAAREGIAFESHGGIPFVRVRVGGGPERAFVLDTGARPCVIDAALARSLGLRGTRGATGRGGAGSFGAEVIETGVEMTIGGAPVACAELWATDLAGVGRTLGRPVDGIVGGDFFRGRVVRIDYDAGRVTVSGRAGYAYRGPGARVPIAVRRNRPHLTALLSVPGREEVARELLVDTGSQDAVADSLLLASTDALEGASTTGLGEGFRTVRGRFTRVRIGPYELRDVEGVVPATPIVGGAILGRFNLVFDYDGGWMVLEPRRAPAG